MSKVSRSQNDEILRANAPESDVRMGSPESSDSDDVEFADPTHPENELVPDMLSKEAHAKLDKMVLRRYPWIDDDEKDDHSIYSRVTLIRSLAGDYDQLDGRYSVSGWHSYSDIREIFHKHPWLVSTLNECWRKGSFRTIRLLNILQRGAMSPRPRINRNRDWEIAEEIAVVERSWNRKFEGQAADLLLQTISTYLTTRDCFSSRRANCAPIINSSGTGKSRMVDELSKKVVTIPMCLRRDGSNGFPPYDSHLRDWLLSGRNHWPDKFQRFCQFIYSLLTVTKERLQRLEGELLSDGMSRNDLDEKNTISRQERLATAFRERMIEGQTFENTGQYRQEFFEEVIDRAEDAIHVENGTEKERSSGFRLPRPHHDTGVRQAGANLTSFICPPEGFCRENQLQRPLVLLAFDEAHQLADWVYGENWTLLSVLRRVLYEINRKPIFALFLSTAADKFEHVDIQDLPPIMEASFDGLAFTAKEGVTTLGEVAQDKWMSHLGRPLFAADYDSWLCRDRADKVLQFAKHKLICGSPTSDMSPEEILACLSVRFALELDMSIPDSHCVAINQVERHLRLCLAATPGFRHLLTVAGSEPILAKAAATIIHYGEDTSVKLLATHPYLDSIDCGRRGELPASLLVMQARDTAHTRTPKTNDREWIYVREFMEALLSKDGYKTLISTLPACRLPDDEKTSFGATFKYSKIWFNHIIKVQQGEMINVRHLWKFVSRGAMIICPPGYFGIDIVLPVCFKGDALTRENMTAILIHVKNDKRRRGDFSVDPFDFIEPFDAGLFSSGDAPLPIIRMVFALGSDGSGVTFPQAKSDPTGTCTSYDIWCEGLSPRTFGCIGHDLSSYRALVERSLQGPRSRLYDLMDLPRKFATEQSKSEREGARRRMGKLAGSHPAHNEKYETRTEMEDA